MTTKKCDPCPFCGNVDKQWIRLVLCEDGEFSVMCGKCGAYGPLKPQKTKAIEAWNCRFIAKELAQ